MTYGAFDERSASVDLSPAALLARPVAGYEYLWGEDPRLLAWLAEYQRPEGGWPEYPTAGTPE